MLAGGVTAFAIGLPIFRLSGLLLAMATLGFGIIVYYVLVNWSGVTGGPSGLTGIPPLALGTWRLDTDARMLWLCWGCLLLLLGLGGNLVESRIGRALATADDRLTPEAISAAGAGLVAPWLVVAGLAAAALGVLLA